jgi:hypothetical protein
VLCVGGIRRKEHTPERYRDLSFFEHSGDSYIIDPRGEVIAGPAAGETILTARCSLEAVLQAKAVCDVGGHYSRPDLLQLLVHRRPPERTITAVEQPDDGAPGEAARAGRREAPAARPVSRTSNQGEALDTLKR